MKNYRNFKEELKNLRLWQRDIDEILEEKKYDNKKSCGKVRL